MEGASEALPSTSSPCNADHRRIPVKHLPQNIPHAQVHAPLSDKLEGRRQALKVFWQRCSHRSGTSREASRIDRQCSPRRLPCRDSHGGSRTRGVDLPRFWQTGVVHLTRRGGPAPGCSGNGENDQLPLGRQRDVETLQTPCLWLESLFLWSRIGWSTVCSTHDLIWPRVLSRRCCWCDSVVHSGFEGFAVYNFSCQHLHPTGPPCLPSSSVLCFMLPLLTCVQERPRLSKMCLLALQSLPVFCAPSGQCALPAVHVDSRTEAVRCLHLLLELSHFLLRLFRGLIGILYLLLWKLLISPVSGKASAVGRLARGPTAGIPVQAVCALGSVGRPQGSCSSMESVLR